jgi:hypothetical protein
VGLHGIQSDRGLEPRSPHRWIRRLWSREGKKLDELMPEISPAWQPQTVRLHSIDVQ